MHQRPTTIAVCLLDEPTAVCAHMCVCVNRKVRKIQLREERLTESLSSNPKAAVVVKSIIAKNERSGDAYLWPAHFALLSTFFLTYQSIHPSVARLPCLTSPHFLSSLNDDTWLNVDNL